MKNILLLLGLCAASVAARAADITGTFVVPHHTRNVEIGLGSVGVYLCTPAQWASYQENRKTKFLDEYQKQLAHIRAQGFDSQGFSAAVNGEWQTYRRWHRTTYDELPEFFAETKTDAKGRFTLPETAGPYVLFARAERTRSQGWEFLVWIKTERDLSRIEPEFGLRAATKEEPWGELPRRSPVRSGIEIY
jgi:hypothetical protein